MQGTQETVSVLGLGRSSGEGNATLPSGSLHKPLILIHQRADRRYKNSSLTASRQKPQSQKANQNNHMDHSLCISVKLWAMQGTATHDRWVTVESSDKSGPLEMGMANFSILALRNPGTVWKGRRYNIGRWACQVSGCSICYLGTAEKLIQKEEAEPKWKQCLVVDVSVGESKVQCYKEQYYIETGNVRSMDQGKLDMVKQEMGCFCLGAATWSHSLWHKPSWRSPLTPQLSCWEDDLQAAEQLYQRHSLIVKIVLGPTTDLPTWGSGKGTENPQGISLWRPVGFDYRTYTGLGKQTLEGHK